MKKIISVLVKVLGVVLGIVVLFVGTMTVIEYRPADIENLDVNGNTTKTLKAGASLSVMTWNIGYGGLSANADFFMDGGKNVVSCDKEKVNNNIAGIINGIKQQNPDIVILQEVDEKSRRSYKINEYKKIANDLDDYDYVQAYNYICAFVPMPVPPIGKVKSGLATYSDYDIASSSRISLPCPFKWPSRLANLKRCLNVSRIPIEGTEKELVIVNLHLEAYDDGEGKIAQTAMLADILQKEYKAGNYVIAGGDFNQTFSNTDISKYPVKENFWKPGIVDESDFGNEFSLLMDSKVPSCRSLDKEYDASRSDEMQVYVIDGFIVSDNLEINSVNTLDYGFEYTDHNPLLLEVTLK